MQDQNSTKILLFGGSFDPPHPAHLQLPFQVAEKVKAQQLIFIPCADPPLDKGRQLSQAKHRLAMLKLAMNAQLTEFDLKGLQVEISDFEIQRGGRSYSIDTVRSFKAMYPDATLHLLIGTDQLLNFDKWKDWEEIERLAPPLVMCRPPYDLKSQIKALPITWDEPRKKAWIQRMIPVPTIDLSSTQIRQTLAAGQGDLSSLGLDEELLSYIQDHGLYKAVDQAKY